MDVGVGGGGKQERKGERGRGRQTERGTGKERKEHMLTDMHRDDTKTGRTQLLLWFQFMARNFPLLYPHPQLFPPLLYHPPLVLPPPPPPPPTHPQRNLSLLLPVVKTSTSALSFFFKPELSSIFITKDFYFLFATVFRCKLLGPF